MLAGLCQNRLVVGTIPIPTVLIRPRHHLKRSCPLMAASPIGFLPFFLPFLEVFHGVPQNMLFFGHFFVSLFSLTVSLLPESKTPKVTGAARNFLDQTLMAGHHLNTQPLQTPLQIQALFIGTSRGGCPLTDIMTRAPDQCFLLNQHAKQHNLSMLHVAITLCHLGQTLLLQPLQRMHITC